MLFSNQYLVCRELTYRKFTENPRSERNLGQISCSERRGFTLSFYFTNAAMGFRFLFRFIMRILKFSNTRGKQTFQGNPTCGHGMNIHINADFRYITQGPCIIKKYFLSTESCLVVFLHFTMFITTCSRKEIISVQHIITLLPSLIALL